MVHFKGKPLFPRKSVVNIKMTIDSESATVDFTARQYVPEVETADCARSTVDDSVLLPEERQEFRRLLVKMFESQMSQAQLGTDEYVPPVEAEGEPA